jgi:4'-phosphopantetheinyl transferase
MNILAVCIDDIDMIYAERLINVLPEKLKSKVKQKSQVDDRLRSLTGGMVTQVYAFEHWGLTPREFTPVQNQNGKPFLSDYPYHYNISHSGKWVVCAFSECAEVGIDVEMIRPIDLELVNRFFSKSEATFLSAQPQHMRITYFFQLWTLKECYIKAKGEGLSLPLNAFSFEVDDDKIHFYTTLDSEIWHFNRYNLDSGYEMAVCGHTNDFPEKINIISWSNLAERYQQATRTR